MRKEHVGNNEQEKRVGTFTHNSELGSEQYSIFLSKILVTNSTRKYIHPTNARFSIRNAQGIESGFIEGQLRRTVFSLGKIEFFDQWIKNLTSEVGTGQHKKHLIQEAMVYLLQSGIIDVDYGDNIMIGNGFDYYQRLRQDSRIIATPPRGLRRLWKYEAR